MLRTTSITAAPWYVIEGVDRHYREITVATLLLDALRKATADAAARSVAPQGARARARGARQRRGDPHRSTLRKRLPKKRRTSDELARWQAQARAADAPQALSRVTRSCSRSKARMPPARAAPSAASPARSMRAST